MTVVGDHSEAECDRHQKRREVVEVKARGMSACGGERGFDAEPGDQDDSERTKEVGSHRLKHPRMLSHELGQIGKKIVHGAGRHRFLLTAFATRAWPNSRPQPEPP